MRTFGIYTFSNFPIINTAVLTIISMLYIVLIALIYLITVNVYLLSRRIDMLKVKDINHEV